MDNQERLAAIRALNKHPGWDIYLKPDLERMLQTLESDVLKNDELSPEDREAKRNQAKAIRKVIKKPERDLMELSKQMKEEQY